MAFSFESTKTFNSCCCGCTLRTGAIIIAVLSMLNGLTPFMDKNQKKGKNKFEGLEDPAWFQTVFNIGYIITSILAIIMLIGILKRRKNFMLPWLYFIAFYFFIACIYSVYVVIVLFIKVSVTMGIAGIVGVVIGVALLVYFWLIEHSYYIHLKEEEETGRSANYTA
ncbi:uncharacterized protein LOC103512915 [Diaphorina citri]|uniref:Uncharacterized protein LOC103512915 n=1 Tax=Diaphorina citri TaxID=121845 RepID=A0A1S3D8Q1_DIACI|nr:uncharacterized protein LOC103512915 [Diaphorina citri]XP_008475926.1 uncharacterized protein LOC103512915 [Diaphorina citri]XP_008475927.1 uncharacterized protein LOC103512915 [Diaphorina citri]XP_008475928.1 uncharacterized protein LOC103512915 [Diaphorina citri]XP_008475929.1 uncharacterized protein LOC103512915 [Diaphorina citri]XP_008475930.1 uncharacterized protein LOC103512915 [Diaphorina citri]